MSSKELISSTKYTQNNLETKPTTKTLNLSNSKKLSVVPEQDEQVNLFRLNLRIWLKIDVMTYIKIYNF